MARMTTAAHSFGLFGAPLDSPNRGVQALGRATVSGVARTYPGSTVTVFDDGWGVRPGSFGRLGDVDVELCGVRVSRRVHRPETWARIRLSQALGGLGNPTATRLRSVDAVLDVSGGDSFSDIYGMHRFRQVMEPKLATLRAGTPLLLLPQTYGPFRDPKAKEEAASVVRSVTAAFSRDEASHEILLDLLGSSHDPERHRHGVDMAFAMDPADPGAGVPASLRELLTTEHQAPLAGLNVSGLIYGVPGAAERFGLSLDYRDTVLALARGLLDDGATVVLVPHVSADAGVAFENDLAACERVAEELGEAARAGRVLVAPGALDADEAKWVISHLDWFNGTRMHSTIAGLSSRVATSAIAYSAKTRGVFATCGAADQVVDARTATTGAAVEELLASWRDREPVRARLEETVPDINRRSREQVRDVLALALGATEQTHSSRRS